MGYYNPITTISSVGTTNTVVPVTIASPTEPTARENGASLSQGDNWYNNIDGKDYLYIVDDTNTGEWKLVGTGDTANYTLPIASVNTLGGIKVGTGTQINSSTGTLDVISAEFLTPGRTLWGRYFNGTENISGNIDSVGIITGTTNLVLKAGDDSSVFFRATSTGNQYMFNNSTGTFQGNLKFEGLTASRVYNFPDKGGTIAVTSDITLTLDAFKDVVAASSDFADFQSRVAAL